MTAPNRGFLVSALLILAIVLLLIFGVGGFFLHLLWIGLIIALIIAIVSFVGNKA
jgi:hypothetical protein